MHCLRSWSNQSVQSEQLIFGDWIPPKPTSMAKNSWAAGRHEASRWSKTTSQLEEKCAKSRRLSLLRHLGASKGSLSASKQEREVHLLHNQPLAKSSSCGSLWQYGRNRELSSPTQSHNTSEAAGQKTQVCCSCHKHAQEPTVTQIRPSAHAIRDL